MCNIKRLRVLGKPSGNFEEPKLSLRKGSDQRLGKQSQDFKSNMSSLLVWIQQHTSISFQGHSHIKHNMIRRLSYTHTHTFNIILCTVKHKFFMTTYFEQGDKHVDIRFDFQKNNTLLGHFPLVRVGIYI